MHTLVMRCICTKCVESHGIRFIVEVRSPIYIPSLRSIAWVMTYIKRCCDFAHRWSQTKTPARGGAWCFSCMPLTQMSSPPGSELPASRNSGWTMLLPAPKMSLMSFQMKRSVHVLPSAPIATPPEIAVSWSRFCSLSTLRVCLPACLRFCFWGHEWPCVVWSLSSHNVFFVVGWRSCATR